MSEAEVIADIHAQLRIIAEVQKSLASSLAVMASKSHSPTDCELRDKVVDLMKSRDRQAGGLVVVSVIAGALGIKGLWEFLIGIFKVGK